MDISDSIYFKDVCVLLEKVKNAKILAKEKYLHRFYESFQKYRIDYRSGFGVEPQTKEDGSTSFFCVLRLLIPGADNTRSAYRMQIPTLAKTYIRVLQLIPSSRDAQKLQARSYQGISGDYASVVHSVISPRATKRQSSLKLKEVHQLLDKVATDDIRTTESVLTHLMEVASADEQMWFVRLLLKSMHLGIGERRIFNILHPQAHAIYQRCSSLLNVCCLLADNNLPQTITTTTRTTVVAAAAADETATTSFATATSTNNNNEQIDLNNAVQPFSHIRPMLCETFPGNLEQLLASDVLYMETKMDGERFQLHFANGQFKYLSRNGVDYTMSFGENYNAGSLTPHLENLLPIGMDTIIIDGEMMVWDNADQRFREKGENTDVKHLIGYPTCRPCFIAYDLLYFNGNSYLDMSYVKRNFKLREILKEQTHILQIMRPQKILSIEHFKTLFQKAMDDNDEGIVVKKQNSTYKPGVRNGGGWYKVKADYIDGLTKEFDLIIMGGYYNRARTFIESFLVGVIELIPPQKYKVFSVGRVANNSRQRVVLNAQLKKYWRNITNEPPPLWYHYKSAHIDERPDVWIMCEDSLILEIKATDLVPSAAFVTEKSLHFPRIISWRNDKSWNDCLTLDEYKKIMQGKKGIKKIHQRQLELNDFASNRRRKLTVAEKRKIGLTAYETKFNPHKVKCLNDLLSGFSFCILSGATAPKTYTIEELKEHVHLFGGEIVENPSFNDHKCICIAGDMSFRVETMLKSKRLNIVKLKWLLNACKFKNMELKPKDFLTMTNELKQQFADLYDIYGDSFVNPLEIYELREILQDIEVEAKTAELEKLPLDSTADSVADLENDLYKRKSPNIFQFITAAFYDLGNDFDTDLAKIIFEFYLGKTVDAVDDDVAKLRKIDYVFVNKVAQNFDEKAFTSWLQKAIGTNLEQIRLLKIDWISDSYRIKQEKDIEEYVLHDL